jgi:ribonucleoside-diphosphate reductase alpha chain
MTNWRDGKVNFEQCGVEFPSDWSLSARQIVASKYFRGQMGTSEREYSLKQLIDRVVDTYVDNGTLFGYFASDKHANIFSDELKYMLLHQMFAFNSPVWFNIGTNAPQQVSACFLLSVDDDMHSILNWITEEGMIFKGGSGSGVNLSRLRGSMELLSSGGTASGPISFMRGADASAGAIKSGGSTRRAAKLVCLDVDHPDIRDFVRLKVEEERKIRVLADAGFDMDLGGKDMASVQYQNANNSIRLSNEFMQAVENGDQFALRARLDGSVVERIDARELFTEMAASAHACADPGVQYDDTINAWHTCPEDGRITTSNPCSEYMHLDNSSCNLASLNLLMFRTGQGFNTSAFIHAVELVITAMDISISFADFPTDKIAQVSRAYRQLGIGYCNLGALLMSLGKAYDSDGGRALAASITSLMSAVAWHRSAELAGEVGCYDGYHRNANAHNAVIKYHLDAALSPVSASVDALDSRISGAALQVWSKAIELGSSFGYRNSQVSLIAPTGTISFMMDADTTGIEPEFALVKLKKLVGGGSLQIVNQSVPQALATLGYDRSEIDPIIEYIAEHGNVIGAPGLDPQHYEVFDCAVGERSIASMGHVHMMAAVQPYLCGAISKTINMPEDATVADIEYVYMQGWKLGLKSLAVYRDNCKSGQPLTHKKKEVASTEATPHTVVPVRHKLPPRRPSVTTSIHVGGAEAYLTASRYPDNGVGEIFLKLGKQGSTLAGVLDALSIAISIALQYGVPLSTFVEKFTGMQFEPRGMTNDPELPMATSLLDYVFRRMALDYLPLEERAALSVFSAAERTEATEVPVEASPGHRFDQDAPLCSSCGIHMTRAGVCFACSSCGSTSGCS